jgi:hypothetical protein
VPNATGKWKLIKGKARVVWSEGWRDIVRGDGDRFRKIAFESGTSFESARNNADSADQEETSANR